MENRTLITKLTTLDELFTGRRFKVPDYQRGYAWGETQVKALLEDLGHITPDGSMHYTGTLVLVKSKDQIHSNYTYYDIVDGQQRLTTLIILLSVLLDRDKSLPDHKALTRLYKVDGDAVWTEEYALRLNATLDRFFRRLLDGERLDTFTYLSERRLQQAKNITENWVKENEEKTEGFIAQTLFLVTQRLGILVYCPQHEEEAGMMFEVINNRGKALSELEKVKNYLIYYAVKTSENPQSSPLRSRIDEEWGEILKNLSLAHSPGDYDRQILLRAVVVLYFGHRKTESNASYNTLKNQFKIDSSHVKQDAVKLGNFVSILRTCSKYYELLLNADLKKLTGYDESVKKQVALIRVQTSHMSILPLFLWGFYAREKYVIDDDQLTTLLEYLERLNFRVYMAPNGAGRSDSGFGRLFEIATNVFGKVGFRNPQQVNDGRENLAVNSAVFEKLLTDIENFTTSSRRGGTIENLVKSLAFDEERNFDAYAGWRKGNRYFLFNYVCSLHTKRTYPLEHLEHKRKDGEINDYVSLEHLWAQNYSLLGSESDEKAQKGRLANLVWLEMGINISASDKPIEEKLKDLHDKSNTGDGSTSLMVGRARKVFMEVVRDLRGFTGEMSLDSCVETVQRLDKQQKYALYVRFLDQLEKPMLEFARTRWMFPRE